MKTILLIENKLDILENLFEAFEMEGYNVICANNGSKGISLASEFLPDLIVSAIRLGKVDGYMVLKALLSQPRTFDIPFIFSTTKSEKKDELLALKLGADDYIIKPYGLEEIIAMAKNWINSGSKRVVKKVSNYPSIANASLLRRDLVSAAVAR